MILAQLALIAQLSFSNGTTAQLKAHSGLVSQGLRGIVVVISKPNYPPIVTSLDKYEALGWAYIAHQMAVRDSLYATGRDFLPIVKHTLTCGQDSCAGSIIDVAIFGTSYAYLRPGPLPKAELKTVARLLYYAAGLQPDSLITIPWTWRQP